MQLSLLWLQFPHPWCASDLCAQPWRSNLKLNVHVISSNRYRNIVHSSLSICVAFPFYVEWLMMMKTLCIMGGACRMHRLRMHFYSENLNTRDHFQELTMSMMTIENDLKKFILRIQIGFIWLRTESTNRILWKKQWILKFHTRNLSTWSNIASEGLCSSN